MNAGRGARLLLLLGLTGVLLAVGLGQAPLERAEIYFVDGARAMVERGDYLVPLYRGEPFFDKPPLTYWLIAGAFEAWGFRLEAARFVPAVAALLAVLVTVWLGALLFGRDEGWLGGLVLATTPAFLSFGRIAMSDMLLALCSTLAFALAASLLLHAQHAPASDGRRVSPLLTLLALGATLGVGFLAKGPVALLLPGLGLATLAWRFRARARALPLTALLAGAAAFLAVALPWFVLVQRRLGWAPLEYFFLHENLERFAGATYDSGEPFFYYLVVYATQGLPWSPFLVPALLRLVRREGESRDRRSSGLLVVWAGLMLVPLSLSHGKIDYYLLPAYPALSLLVARFLRQAWTRGERALVRAVLVSGALALLLSPLLASRLPPDWLPPEPVRWLAHGVTLGLCVALAWAAVRLRPARATAVLAAAAAAAFLFAAGFYLPALRRAQPNAAIVRDVARERIFRPDARLVFCTDPTRVARDLLFAARVVSLERCDLWAPAASRLPFLLLLPEGQRESLRAATRFVGEYAYVPAEVTTLSRLMKPVEPARLVLLANYSTSDPEADRRMRKDRKRRVRERERSESQAAEPGVIP